MSIPSQDICMQQQNIPTPAMIRNPENTVGKITVFI